MPGPGSDDGTRSTSVEEDDGEGSVTGVGDDGGAIARRG